MRDDTVWLNLGEKERENDRRRRMALVRCEKSIWKETA